MELPGYTVVADLHRGRKRLTRLARRESDGIPVIIKTLAAEVPTPADTASLRREFEILRGLEIPGTPRALALVSHRDRLALVLESAGDATLRSLIADGSIDLPAFLRIAHQVGAVLAALHRAGIVHKDVNPSNIVVDRATGRATLLDFGIASRHQGETPRLDAPHLIEGTLAYMSPEQTGRMNRELDYRSDLYSLGVTCYEMLTRRLPFDSHDPLEVIHGHVAQIPVPPHEIDPRIPTVVSALVMRLLAKSADDRYQSGEGLVADLERCQELWQRDGRIDDFPLGGTDVRDRFVVSQRLHGREGEIALLLEAFERVAEGRSEFVLVSGYAGIGKTSLIQEIHRSLARRRGCFVTGKFDQLARDVPYGALAQAFQSFVRQILAEPDERVAAWRRDLLRALGPNGQVAIDLIPDLVRLLGPQPPVQALGATESQNRFTAVFRQFVRACADPAHPLVLFLDDLQWADPGTLSLLPHLVNDPSLTGLLVIGAYRDNETPPSHPLHQLVGEMRAKSAHLTEVALPALEESHIAALIAETVELDPGSASDLSAIVLEKTAGNPFFVTQFLKSLHQDGHIAFDRASGSWRCDAPAIRGLGTTDNVVDLMASRILRLEEPTRHALRLAACVGSSFDLATLATVSAMEPEPCAKKLWPAVEQGLIRADERSYGLVPRLADGRPANEWHFQFLHDRVQQAAYALIPPAERKQAHLTIGRLLIGDAPSSEIQDNLFEIVQHLNVGAELIGDGAERLRLAELNLKAGRKAKASAAFPAALGHFTAGVSLLPGNAWQNHYALSFALHIERAEALYLTGRLEEAERSYADLLQHVHEPFDRVDVHVLMTVHYETTSRYEDAIQSCLDGLRLLGVELPTDPAAGESALAADLAAIRAFMGERPIVSLLDLPRLTDPKIHKVMRMLQATWAPSYIAGHVGLRDLVPARMVRLSLEHGNCEESAFGYCLHATTVGYTLGQYQRAYEFGRLAIALNEGLHDFARKAVVLHRFAALVNPWRQPYATSIPIAQEAVRTGLESGDLIVAGYAQFQQTWYGMQIEPLLDGFLAKYSPVTDYLARVQAHGYLEVQKMMLVWAMALAGRTEVPTRLVGLGIDETEYVDTFGKGGILASFYATIKLELLNRFADPAARDFARDHEARADVFTSSIWPAMFAFNHVLAICAWLPTAPAAERAAAEAKLGQLAERLRIWAANSPQNFEHHWLLALAEIARVHGAEAEAFSSYEKALAAMQAHETPRHRALANELYAGFWLGRGQPRVAAIFMNEARYCYAQWGASAKVADLERRYGPLLRMHAEHPEPSAAGTMQTTATLESAIDFGAVMKAAQAVASEIDFERLLGRLMRVAIENAGAERGHLLLEQEGAPAVLVSGSRERVTLQLESATALSEATDLPQSVVNYVRRSGELVVLADAADAGAFTGDPYIVRERPRSVVAVPLTNQARLVGTLYLENNLASGVFTAERARVLQILAAQAAIAIENARMFAEIGRLRDRLQAENVYLIEEIKTRHGFEEIVGRTAALKKVQSLVEQVAPTDSTVLITGETGTGKELVARAVHNLSTRRERPLVTVNCGTISPGLVESELFGHEKGAFTGALARKIGRFEVADGGTIFLDEIGDLPGDLQVKLLRVLQEGEIERVGGSRTIRVDVRVIAATNRDLEQLARNGEFRADLYYRLNVFPIHSPALRDRRADIPLLVHYFVAKYAKKFGKRIESIPSDVMQRLESYSWPGNIRELSNVLERAVIVSRGPTLEPSDWISSKPQAAALDSRAPDPRSLEDVERSHIVATLEHARWRVSGPQGAAAVLGLKPTTLEARMKKLGIERPR